jgi:hypothetical protein
MINRPSYPNRTILGLLSLAAFLSASTVRGPLASGGKVIDLIIGVVVLFGSVLLFGQYRIVVSKARRTGGFREWAGPLSSQRLAKILLTIAFVSSISHIYESCLKIFAKVFE